MAERLAYLEAVVGADITQFRRGMRDVRNEVGLFSEAMNGLSAIGRTMTFAVTVPIITGMTYAVQAASEFDAAMRNINSILQLSEGEFDVLSQQVLAFGSDIRSGPMGAAEALYVAVSAGITDTTTALSVMEVASRTADAGLADLETTANALIGTFLSYGGDQLPLSEQLDFLTHQSDVLSQMVMVGVGSMQAFATAQANAIPTAAALGGSYDDLGGMMAFLTQRGLSAATAGVSLTAAMTGLLNPATALEAQFASLGVSGGEALIDMFGGLDEAMIALIQRAQEIATADGLDLSTVIGRWFPNIRAQRAVLAMANNLDSLNDTMVEFHANVEGATGRAQEQQLLSFAAHWDLMTSALRGAAIAIGDVLLPVLTPVLDGIADIAGSLAETSPEVLALATGFLGLAAAIGPVLWLVSSLVNPISAVVVGVGALATAFTTNFGGIRDTVSKALTDIFGDLSGLNSAVDLLVKALFPPNAQAEADEMIRRVAPHVTIDAEQVFSVTVPKEGTLYSAWTSSEVMQAMFPSWGQFLAAARAAGYNASDVQAGDVLNIPGTFGQEVADMVAGGINSGLSVFTGLLDFIAPVKVNVPVDLAADSTQEPLAVAKTLFETSIVPMLSGMLDALAIWVDDNAFKVLISIADLFQPTAKGGDSPIYRAFNDLLSGNITAAINDVIPGLGTSIQTTIEGWGASINEAFPKIQIGLQLLIGRIVNWTLNEGIPTLERMSGNLVGHLAVALYDAIAGVVDFLSSGAAGNTAGAVGDYIGKNVIQPWQEGFNEAIAGTRLETEGIPGAESLISGIFDGINTAIEDFANNETVQLVVGKLQKFGDAIGAFLGEVTAGDWSFIPRLIEIGAALLGWAALTAVDFLTSFLPPLGTAIKNIANALSGFGSKSPAEILASFADGVLSLGVALLSLPVSFINTINDFFKNVLDIDLKLPDLTAALEEFRANVDNAFSTGLDVSQAIVVTPTGIEINAETGEIFEAAQDWLREQGLGIIAEGINEALGDEAIDFVVDGGKATISITNQDVLADEWTSNMLAAIKDQPLTLDNLAVLLTNYAVRLETGPDTVVAAGGTEITLPPTDVTMPLGTVTAEETDSTNADNIKESIIAPGVLRTYMEEQGTDGLSGLAVAVAASFAEGGINDPVVVRDSYLIPIYDYFNVYLGEEGAVTAVLAGFVVTVAEETVKAMASLLTLGVTAATTGAGMVLALSIQTPLINNLLGSIKGAVDGVTTAFGNMAAAAREALSAASQVPGSPVIAGARAFGGDVLAGSTYLVGERGPELFTAPQSGQIISNEALLGGARSGGVGGGVVYQYVTINEASNLDQILYEAKRRGIALGGA